MLLEEAHARTASGQVDPDADDCITLLLAVSDSWSQKVATGTRRFLALVAIAQHCGGPSTPTDQAWIKSLNGTLKAAWLHLCCAPALVEALNPGG